MLGREQGTRGGIGQHQQGSAHQRCSRQQQALVVTQRHAHQVRHDESDETDAAGGTDSHRRGERGNSVNQPAQTLHRNTKRVRGVLTARQQIEIAREGQGQGQRNDQRDQGGQRFNNMGQIAHQPEQHAAQPFLRRDGQQQCNHGAAASGNDHTGEQQARLRPGTLAMGQTEYQQHRAAGTGKGEAIDREQRQTKKHCRQCAHPRAAGNTEDVGISKRIAQQNLHQGAGHRQQPAAGEAGQGARQAQLQHHLARQAVAAR